MINVVIFSKDRPMQLRAYLESFDFYSKYRGSITVITPSKELYSDIAWDLPWVNWIDEKRGGGFHSCINSHINSMSDSDIILFGVDDCVWFKPFNPYIAAEILSDPAADNIIGFTFRLGINVKPYDNSWNLCKDPRFAIWQWNNKTSHWSYPFEVTSSIYRAVDIKEYLNNTKRNISLPNDLEAFGYHYAWANWQQKRPFLMMMNSDSYSAAADINRCQDVYQNKVAGGEDINVENLNKMYQEGKRLAWWNYFDMKPNDCFIGTQNLLIT